jgi:hypothetical protein
MLVTIKQNYTSHFLQDLDSWQFIARIVRAPLGPTAPTSGWASRDLLG